MIKHGGHLRPRGKCRKYEPKADIFYIFVECSQMSGEFYHSVVHGLGFFIYFRQQMLHTQNNQAHFLFLFKK